jgi:hypothetical protein
MRLLLSLFLLVTSFCANAVIQSVPANAQLIPFWYHLSPIVSGEKSTQTDTVAKITVAKSIGIDLVISHLNSEPIVEFESTGNADLSPVINNDTFLLPGGNNNQPLVGVGDAIDANLYSNSFIHWWFLDTKSKHIVNGRIPVSQDDAVVIDAANMGTSGAVSGISSIPSNVPGYLVLTNESARNGGAPVFSFTADSWVTNLGSGIPSSVNIPVFGMVDGVDETTYPTPINQVIQNQKYTTSPFYPVASPLTTGVRTGVAGPAVDNIALLKVVEIPLADRNQFDNFVFVWNDKNLEDNGVIPVEEIDQDENACSSNLLIPQQLNVAWFPSNNVSNVNRRTNIPSFMDSYSGLGAKKGSAFDDNQLDGKNNGNLGCQTSSRDGYLKLYIPLAKKPNGFVQGAYSSMVMFTIPQLTFPSEGSLQLSTERPTSLGVDRGFFTGR